MMFNLSERLFNPWLEFEDACSRMSDPHNASCASSVASEYVQLLYEDVISKLFPDNIMNSATGTTEWCSPSGSSTTNSNTSLNTNASRKVSFHHPKGKKWMKVDPEVCCVCFGSKCEIRFFPCNHAIACAECYEGLWNHVVKKDFDPIFNCPMCREKVYFAQPKCVTSLTDSGAEDSHSVNQQHTKIVNRFFRARMKIVAMMRLNFIFLLRET